MHNDFFNAVCTSYFMYLSLLNYAQADNLFFNFNLENQISKGYKTIEIRDISFEKLNVNEKYVGIDDFDNSNLTEKSKRNNENNENYKNEENDVSDLNAREVAVYEFESKKIPVLMFHKFEEPETRYSISSDNFKALLKDLYDNDFFSVTLDEFVRGDFSDVPVGKKPVLFTFDDASISQFKMNADSTINEDCAVGILDDFYSEFDFGKGGVFFVNYGTRNDFNLPFEQEDFASSKIKYLLNNDYDVAYHTVFHDNNLSASENNIFEQSFISKALMKDLAGNDFDKVMRAYAHPFGSIPKNDVVFDYLTDKYDVIMNAWGGMSHHPLSERFDVTSIPRIEITKQTLDDLVLNKRYVYEVTPETWKFYAKMKDLKLYEEKIDTLKLKPVLVEKINDQDLSFPIMIF